MRREGYTLLELLLVMAIIVIMMAIAIPSLAPLFAEFRMDAAADTAKAGLNTARSQAVEEGQSYAFAIIPGKGNYRVAPDSPGYWSGTGNPQMDEGEQRSLVVQDHLPKGVIFTDSPDAARPDEGEQTVLGDDEIGSTQWKKVAVFLPDGTALETKDIGLLGVSGPPMTVCVRCLTGAVSSRRGSGERRE